MLKNGFEIIKLKSMNISYQFVLRIYNYYIVPWIYPNRKVFPCMQIMGVYINYSC